jgi:Protein of unknown function (DUF3093)
VTGFCLVRLRDQRGTPGYRERLTVPLRWWVQATMFLATIWLALVVSTPAWLAWTGTGACAAVAFGLLGYVGSTLVEVTDGQLHAGRARIPTRLLGVPEQLDKDATRRVLGVDADARAFLLTRPYLRRSVRVPIQDPDDPTPYWLVATRHPDRLAAALTPTGRGATGSH